MKEEFEHPDFMDLIDNSNNYREHYIEEVMNYGYTREEAINILDGKNPDGSSFCAIIF